MLSSLRERISKDRIAIGMVRFCTVLLVGTAVFICWRQTGEPYAVMQERIAKIPEFYATQLDSGTPVYFGPVNRPQRLQVQVGLPPYIDVAQPALIDDAAECIKKFKNPSVHIVQQTTDVGPFHLPQSIVLFDEKADADKVFSTYAPLEVTPDFRDIDRDGRLGACVVSAYMKIRATMNSNIANAKRDFYLGSAQFLGEAMVAEITFCVALYWILAGFFRRR
jgi:hypothetical protein